MDLKQLSETCRLLGDSLELIDDAIVVCRQGVHVGASDAEQRALGLEIAALERRREAVAACMGTLAGLFPRIPVPPGYQAGAVADLTREMEALMACARSPNRAVELASRVVVLTDEVETRLRPAAPQLQCGALHG